MERLFVLPAYCVEVSSVARRRDWLVHAFQTSDLDAIYNPAEYLARTHNEGTSFTAVLDLNVFQYLVGVLKKPGPQRDFRDAAAFLAFCQLSGIDLDPTHAVYERVDYDASNLDEALSDLNLFHQINNAEPELLAKYALGYADEVVAGIAPPVDRDALSEGILRYQRLTDWDSLYLMLLAIARTYYDASTPPKRKLITFLDWMIREFRLSLPAIAYAAILFGTKPQKRMMKLKPSLSAEQRRKAVYNMTWDLYLIDRFSKHWTTRSETSEYVYVSDDRALRAILRLAIDVQSTPDMSALQEFIADDVFPAVRKLLVECEGRTDRVYGTFEWTREHRKALIVKHEEALF